KRLGQATNRPLGRPNPERRPSHASNGTPLGQAGNSKPRSLPTPASNRPVLATGERSNGSSAAPPGTPPGRNGDGKVDTHQSTTSSTQRKVHDRVIESFQQTMQTFLEVQRSTMLAYLKSQGSAPSPHRPLSRPEPAVERGDDASGFAAGPT